MKGILIINKQEGFTSQDVVSKVKKILNIKKAGHTGTLDPMATGVLPILLNEYTKLSKYLIEHDKTYIAELVLGKKTDTGDREGNVLENTYLDNNILKKENIEKILSSFLGKQLQTPPMYSAIKVNGKKLYELAREGIEIEREARKIEIFEIKNIEWKDETLKYTVHCSKGTYIRSLCEDIAGELGTIGTMTNLRRIQSGEFQVKDAIKIEDISEKKIISIEKLFDKEIDVKNNLKELLNGMKIQCIRPDGLYKLYADKFIGIGKIEKNYLKREIIL